jgi:hypothetical protein
MDQVDELAEAAGRLERVAVAMRLSESAVLSVVLTSWKESSGLDAWLAEENDDN